MENTATVIAGTAGGNHVTDGPLTVSAVREASPELLLNEIDSRIVKVRPMATPIDQISRMVGARRAKSMIVDYYSVDTKPCSTTFTERATDTGKTFDNYRILSVKTANDRIFSPTETLLVPALPGYDGNKVSGSLVLYVVSGASDSTPGLQVIVLNPDPSEMEENRLPEIKEGMEVVRMGRAASELDVQTPQFEALPVKSRNFCQIFKAQVENSTYVKLSAKETGWTFSDQEEVAIMDMRMGMEKNFLFGVKTRLTDPVKNDEVLFTGGIWNQAGGEETVSLADFSQDTVVDIMRAAFTGTAAGSPRKILVAGSGLVQTINKLDYNKVVAATETVTRWGIDFNELRSKFGSLYVIHSEIFDQCGHENDGLVIDPQYLTKYSHVPFTVEHLDLKKSGVRNTDALVVTEASCLVLRHPKSHLRILGR